MKLLATIARQAGLPASGRTSHRTAVRAIILEDPDQPDGPHQPDGPRLLMVYSPVNGDYKFPGGGLEDGEEHEAALIREILEECGMHASHIGPAFGQVIEYDLPEDPAFDLFQMTSYYYFCQVAPGLQSQLLDDYEADLAFQPVWIDIDEAIRTNSAVLASGRPEIPLWTPRDTFVLQQIKLHLQDSLL